VLTGSLASVWLSVRLQLLAAGLVTAVALLAAAPHLLPPSQPAVPPGPPVPGVIMGDTTRQDVPGDVMPPSVALVTTSTGTSTEGQEASLGSSLLLLLVSGAQLAAATLLSHAHHLVSAIVKVAAKALSAVAGGGSASAVSLSGLSLAYALPVLGVLEGLLSSGAETEAEAVSVERVEQLSALCNPQATVLQPCAPVQRSDEVGPAAGVVA
jgi:hypothetical protein